MIITTAYAEFAIQGYELNVVDYLMKPFSFDRFLKAIQKVEDIIKNRNIQIPEGLEKNKLHDEYIFIKSNKRTYKVNLSNIQYIEALGIM